MKKLITPLAAVAALLASHPSMAEDDWHVVINFPMIWAADISGEFDSNGTVTEIDVPFSDIMENVDVGFMGEIYLNKGPWTVGWRTSYSSIKVSDTSSGPVLNPNPPPLLGRGPHKLETKIELLLNELLVAYQINDTVGLYAGLRRSGSRTELTVKPLEGADPEARGEIDLVDDDLDDWIAGINLHYHLNDNWAATLQADTLLTGDNDTDNNLNAYLSYRFNHHHSLWMGYRYLKLESTTTTDGNRVDSEFTQHGPTLGWTFTF